MTDDPVTLHWAYNANSMEEKLSLATARIEQLEKGFRDILTAFDDALIMSFIARSCLNGAIDDQGRYCYVPLFLLKESGND